MTQLEFAAFRIFQAFIRNGSGTRMWLRDKAGNVIGEETPEQASLRRWNAAPQATRDEFLAYAKAAEPVLRSAA